MVESGYEAYASRVAAARDVTQADIADYATVLEAAADERPLQQFLGSRPGMLSQQLSTGCRWVIALPRLGAEYVPDFVVSRLNSGGLHWTLVELEGPVPGCSPGRAARPASSTPEPGRSVTGGTGSPPTAITRSASGPPAAWACPRSAIPRGDWSSSAAAAR